MTDDIVAKLTSIVEAQQQQIDDTQRLLVVIADAVIAQGDANLAASLREHKASLDNMIAFGRETQRKADERAATNARIREALERGA